MKVVTMLTLLAILALGLFGESVSDGNMWTACLFGLLAIVLAGAGVLFQEWRQ
jgi:hypothetical protein